MNTLETLRLLYNGYDADSWIIAAVVENTGNSRKHYSPHSFRLSNLDAIAGFIEANDGLSVFTSCATFGSKPENGGKKSEVLAVNKLWVEIDYSKDGSNKELAYKRLLAYDPQPSLIVHSGHGYHAYWFLDEPSTDLKAVEERTYYLKTRFGSDSIFDVSRKMRFPGTVNDKVYPAVRATIEYLNDVAYNLEQFAALEPPTSEKPLEIEAEPLPDNFEAVLKSHYGGYRLWRQILSEETAQGVAPVISEGVKAGEIDRHKNDWSIAVGLLSRGFSIGVVTSVLISPVWFSGSKSRERGWGYLESTVMKAAYHVAGMAPPEIAVKGHDWTDNDGKPHPGKFSEEVAASSIIESFHIKWFRGVAYAYVNDSYEPLPDSLVYVALRSKLGENLKESQIDNVTARIMRQSDLFPADEEDSKYWINIQNGLLDIRTSRLIPHTPKIFTPGRIAATWDERVNEVALQRVTSFFGELAEYENVPILFEQLGLCLTTNVPDATKLLMLLGHSNTGKSQVIKFFESFIGQKYTSAVDFALLADDKFYRGALLGRRLNAVNDTNVDYIMKYATALNQLISGEPTEINEKHVKVQASQRLFAKHIAATNKPVFARTSAEGWDSRLLVLRFNHIWQDSDPDRIEGIHREILNDPANRTETLRMAVEGYQRFTKQGTYTETDSSRRATLEHKMAVDPIIGFVLKRTVADEKGVILQKTMKDQIRLYCLEEGIKHMPGLQDIRQGLESYMKAHPNEFSIKFYEKGLYKGYSDKGAVFVGRRIVEELDPTVHPMNGKIHIGVN